MKITRALISVFDKTGLLDLAQVLNRHGVEILSSGGTAATLRKADIPVTEVSTYTASPELFGGRVKTLHPKIHGGILMRRDNPKDVADAKAAGIQPIDLVVVSLYPFEKTVAKKDVSNDEAIENIDIGGVALIRAAAKNSKFVGVVVDPEDYAGVIRELDETGGMSDSKRHNLMIKAFERTSHYDWAISRHFGGEGEEKFPHRMKMVFERAYPLRYGENPHQQAAAYRLVGQRSLFDARIFSGKQMSYNNFLDSDSALHLIREFYGRNACVILKHNNPCGVATGHRLKEAYERAYASDPMSAFGGIIAFSSRLDAETAESMGKQFIEVVLAPGYEPEALEILKAKPSRRILDISDLWHPVHAGDVTFRHITGGMLYQHEDASVYDLKEAKVATQRTPTDAEWRDLHFAMVVAKHVKSNAITIARNEQILGVGAGQMSRIDSTRMAISKARANGFDLKGASAASDAFLPFSDTSDELSDAGVGALAQPGGSINDEKVIESANRRQMALVFTGIRHFKH
ncbi:Bifunctional purine biosynthesis protein PurH [uncultured archaeon]|nr:Bifunctional purine biosynthesis protein PurH [uncultured archaeon]